MARLLKNNELFEDDYLILEPGSGTPPFPGTLLIPAKSLGQHRELLAKKQSSTGLFLDSDD